MTRQKHFSKSSQERNNVDDRVITEGYTREELLDALKSGGMFVSPPAQEDLREDYNPFLLSCTDVTNSENPVLIRGMGFFNWLDVHRSGMHLTSNTPVPYGDETPVIHVDPDSEMLNQYGAGNEFEKLAIIGPDVLKVEEDVEEEFLEALDTNIAKFKKFFLLELAPASIGLSIALDEVNQEIGILLGDANVTSNFSSITRMFEDSMLLRAHEWLTKEIGLSEENAARLIAVKLSKSLPNPSLESANALLTQTRKTHDVLSDVGKLIAKNLKGK